MNKPKPSPRFLALQREQLDTSLKKAANFPTPSGGWILMIRSALGMSARQLGKRMGMTQQGALDLERRERAGSITLAKLQKVAEALDCELRVAFVPRQTLEITVREQAERKARIERDRIVHTMRLEAQEENVDAVLDESHAREAWLTRFLTRLWD